MVEKSFNEQWEEVIAKMPGTDGPTTGLPAAQGLLPCPFCGEAVQFRQALWISDGCTDSVIHAAPSECGLTQFDIGSTDIVSTKAAWNRRASVAPTPSLVGENKRLREALELFREYVCRNARVWEAGAGHHHPIWAHVADLIPPVRIESGAEWKFLQPLNRTALSALRNGEPG